MLLTSPRCVWSSRAVPLARFCVSLPRTGTNPLTSTLELLLGIGGPGVSSKRELWICGGQRSLVHPWFRIRRARHHTRCCFTVPTRSPFLARSGTSVFHLSRASAALDCVTSGHVFELSDQSVALGLPWFRIRRTKHRARCCSPSPRDSHLSLAVGTLCSTAAGPRLAV